MPGSERKVAARVNSDIDDSDDAGDCRVLGLACCRWKWAMRKINKIQYFAAVLCGQELTASVLWYILPVKYTSAEDITATCRD